MIDRQDEMRSYDRDDHLADPDIWAPDDWRDPIFVNKAVLRWLPGPDEKSASMPCRCTLVS